MVQTDAKAARLSCVVERHPDPRVSTRARAPRPATARRRRTAYGYAGTALSAELSVCAGCALSRRGTPTRRPAPSSKRHKRFHLRPLC
eukprot:scaffold52844_cov63-Phaeocystis_antarctica.AAC.2